MSSCKCECASVLSSVALRPCIGLGRIQRVLEICVLVRESVRLDELHNVFLQMRVCECTDGPGFICGLRLGSI